MERSAATTGVGRNEPVDSAGQTGAIDPLRSVAFLETGHLHAYSVTSSARNRIVCEIVRPNDGRGKYVVVENVTTRIGARTMALDPQRQRINLVMAECGPKPPATADKPNPRPPVVPGSFRMLTIAR